MYNNSYYFEMTFPKRIKGIFNCNEQYHFRSIMEMFNDYYHYATRKQTRNKKYISRLVFLDSRIGMYLETEKPIPNPQRMGTSLRQFSRLANESGVNCYIQWNSFMKSVVTEMIDEKEE